MRIFGIVAALGVALALCASSAEAQTSSGGPQPSSPAGSTGTNYDANDPTFPVIGQPFAASGPYASYVLVKTIPALATRNNVETKNSSGLYACVVMRDDGTAAAGAAPNNASLIPLVASGGAVGTQGGYWGSTTFKGRIQVYCASSAAQFTAFVD